MCKIRNAALLFALLTTIVSTSTAQQAPKEEDELFEMSIEELMEVEVTSVSKKKDKLFTTPAAITVITAEEIQRSGHQSIPEVLRMVPGLNVAKVNSNSWAISSRGFDKLYSEGILVMIDGRSVYTPLYSGVYWDIQDVVLEDIERIEIINGPGGTLWGANTANGIINIITKEAKDTQGNLITTGFGSENRLFGTVRHGGKISDNGYYRLYTKFFDRDEAVYSDGDTAFDGAKFLKQGFRVDFYEADEEQLTFQGDYYSGNFDKTTLLVAPGSNYQEDNETGVRGWNLLTRYTKKFSDTSDMSLQFYFDRTERYAIDLDETRDTFDLDFQHRFQLFENHSLVWGLGYRNTSDNTEGSYTISFSPEDETEEVFSAFIQDEITLVPETLKFIIGTKIEKNDYTGFEFQPSARLLYTPDEKNTFWASFTRAVTTPSRTYTDMVNRFNAIPAMTLFGKDDLKSQEVKAYELGWRVKPNDKIFFDLALFYNEHDHIFSNETHTGPFTYTFHNKLYGESYGAQLAVNWRVNDNWMLKGGYSFVRLHMHREEDSTDNTKERQIEDRTPHDSFHIASRMSLTENLEFDTTFYYKGSVLQYDTPAYTRLDIGLTWKLREDMFLQVVGQNLLDPAHPEFGENAVLTTEAQRAVLAKLTWRF
jgi:iron complex outermembrane receptor protein